MACQEYQYYSVILRQYSDLILIISPGQEIANSCLDGLSLGERQRSDSLGKKGNNKRTVLKQTPERMIFSDKQTCWVQFLSLGDMPRAVADSAWAQFCCRYPEFLVLWLWQGVGPHREGRDSTLAGIGSALGVFEAPIFLSEPSFLVSRGLRKQEALFSRSSPVEEHRNPCHSSRKVGGGH